MDKFDEMIGRAISKEDRAMLANGDQRCSVAQPPGWFSGLMRLVYFVVLVTFAGAVYALWQACTSTDSRAAVQWGVAALVLFHITALSKCYVGSHLESKPKLRELKRLELLTAMLRSERQT